MAFIGKKIERGVKGQSRLTPADFVVLSYDDAKRRFPALGKVSSISGRQMASDGIEIRVYEGDLVVDAFEGIPIEEGSNSRHTVIIDGNLIVANKLSWSDYEAGSCLLATGAISAGLIELDGTIWLEAPRVEATRGIVGSRGDNGGVIFAEKLRAPLIVLDTYFGVEAEVIEGLALGDDFKPNDDVIALDDAAKVIRADLLDPDTRNVVLNIREALAAGRDVLRDDLA